MPIETFRFDSELWLWHGGKAAWHFVTLPAELSDEIDFRTEQPGPGFGSVKVGVRIGTSRWSTSIFPSNEREAYVLPVKAEVRKAEKISDGDRVEVEIEVELA